MEISKTEENNLQKIEESYYNNIIYCYVEEQKEELEEFILKYNDENIIHIISSVIESCDGKLLYCLCDIITNYIEASREQENRFYFATDVKGLYNIVKKLYSAIFEDIIYIGQGNNKEFDNGLETDEFINYFLNIQRSKLHSSFMKQLWELRDCGSENEFMKFLYELKGLGIEKEYYLKKLWHCLCQILLYEYGYNEVKNNNFIYKLAIYSILMALDKNVDYTNKYLTEVLNNEVKGENIYFVWNQYKYMSLKKYAAFDKKTPLLQNKLYEKTYNLFLTEFNKNLVKIPLEKRNKNLVMILTIQFLDRKHAPTRTVVERIKALKKLGKNIIIVNTTEQYIRIGYLPIYNTGFGRILSEYDNINQIQIGDNKFPFFQMPESSSIEYRMQVLSELLKKYKPYYILSIGTGSILADLCGNIVPCASMALAFSTLPKTKNKMKILGRRLSEEEKEFYADEDIDIIESRFTFELKPQKNKFSRKEKGIPDHGFVLVVVGIRLDFEIDNSFMEMLTKACNAGCYVVFAGIMDNYKSLMEDYPVVSANSLFTGYCDDILALMEICDLYVNPDRLGGGFSIIEAFAKGKPGVYLKSGDVYTAGGEDFAVNDFDEMSEKILQYKNDKDYYNKMSGLAKERARFMTSSIEAIADIDRQICQKIEKKYW